MSDWRDLAPPPSDVAELVRLRKTAKTMIGVRWAGTAFGLLQALTFYLPYPPGILPLALALVATLAIGNVAIMFAHAHTSELTTVRKLSVCGMALDTLVIIGFTFVYAFDEATSIWALIYIIPLEGAIRFGLRGAIGWMGVATVAYVARELYGSAVFGNEFLVTSISFRMGLGFLVGWVAGGMSSNLAKERRQLEMSNGRHSSLLHALGNLGEGIVMAEPTKILYANEALEQIVGYTSDELRAMPLLSLVAPESLDDILSRIGALSGSEEGDRFDVVAVHRDGRRLNLEVALKHLADSNSAVVVAVIRDVTRRKQAEDETTAALQRERDAVIRLQALDSARSDFLSTVSHELRTPVTTIGGFAHTLMQRWDSLRDSQQRDFVRRISVGASQLNRLISELLDFTRLERADTVLALEEQPMSRVVFDSLVEASPLLEDHWVSCFIEPDLCALTEESSFSRILENLLTNAAKFSPAGTTITIRARSRGAQDVLVEVIDEGMGVPQQDRQKIFERFYRVKRGDTSPSGTGIGLAVVKEFVAGHGGRVWVAPNEPSGSTFSFTLKKQGLRSRPTDRQEASLV